MHLNSSLQSSFSRQGSPMQPVCLVHEVVHPSRLSWLASPIDVNSEVNNGRCPADYKVSYGERDSTIVEFKLASSTSLERNLANQTDIYKRASNSFDSLTNCLISQYSPSILNDVSEMMSFRQLLCLYFSRNVRS